MAAPDSWLTRLRRRAAAAIEPFPAPGEAWCIRCTMNAGRTLIVSADGTRDHVLRHRAEDPAGKILIKTTWPSRPPDEALP